MAKALIFWELPTLMDSTFIFFMGLHFIAFMYIHSERGTKILMKYRQSPYRKVVQETMKGYGKGLKLFKLLDRGIEFNVNPLYFLFVLLIRGTASAIYKTTVLSYLLDKPLRFNKAKQNILFNSLPSMILYLIYIFVAYLTKFQFHGELAKPLLAIFVPTMIVIRSLRTMWKVLKYYKKQAIKAAKALEKKEILSSQCSEEHDNQIASPETACEELTPEYFIS